MNKLKKDIRVIGREPGVFEDLIKDLVKSYVEELLRAELTEFLGYSKYEKSSSDNSRNGYYTRSLYGRSATIEDLNIPRDRLGLFNSSLIPDYRRHDKWIQDLVIKLYSGGMSTREVSDVLDKLFGMNYTPQFVSNITDATIEFAEKWRNRKLDKRYSVIFIDGTCCYIRRDDVNNDVIYLVVGVNEEGIREILGFYLASEESANVWQDCLQDIKDRGVQEVLLFVSDNTSGIKNAVKSIYPKAEIQLCWLHKIKNILVRVRRKDRYEAAQDLKKIYRVSTYKQALDGYNKFIEKWQKKYGELIKILEKDKTELLCFLNYPEEIRSQIYTTNWIERTIKEIKKRLKPMNSIPSENAAVKIVYLTVKNYNERWKIRKLRGFDYCKDELMEMFSERYSDNNKKIAFTQLT